MKTRKSCALVALFTAGCLSVAAQTSPPVNQPDYNKPKLFTDQPQRSTLHLSNAEALLAIPVGGTVDALLAAGFRLTGIVVSKSNPADQKVQSVVIKSTAKGEATFTFTRITNSDGSALYRGRMLSRNAGDALEIAKDGDQYILRKTGYYDLISE